MLVRWCNCSWAYDYCFPGQTHDASSYRLTEMCRSAPFPYSKRCTLLASEIQGSASTLIVPELPFFNVRSNLDARLCCLRQS